MTLACPNAHDPAICYRDGIPCRLAEFSRLLPMWPKDICDLSVDGRRRTIAELARALRLERCRARSGHWAYDVARHSQLYRLWQRECGEVPAAVPLVAQRGAGAVPAAEP